MTEEDFVINNYAFQTVAISGTQGSVIISGLNDFNALSGSQTQAFPANPYPEAFVDSNGATTVYGALGMPYGQHSTGGAINNLGQAVGSSGHYAQTARGYLYAGGSFTRITGPQDRYRTSAYGINDRGQVVGNMSPNVLIPGSSGGTKAFVWKNGTVTQTFSYPGASSTTATGINDAGGIVGVYSLPAANDSYHSHGFLDTNGHFTAIDVPGAQSTQPEAINNRGDIVGTYYDGAHYHGFLDHAGQMAFINAPGATDTWLNADNDFGQVAGYYRDTSGATRDFVATPGNGKNLPRLAEMAPLPAIVSQLTGASTGHAYFDPSQPVTLVAVAHS
jgi:uncharacterized membrane protein